MDRKFWTGWPGTSTHYVPLLVLPLLLQLHHQLLHYVPLPAVPVLAVHVLVHQAQPHYHHLLSQLLHYVPLSPEIRECIKVKK